MKIWNKVRFSCWNEEERLFVPNISQRFRLQRLRQDGTCTGRAPWHDVSCRRRLKRDKISHRKLCINLRSALRCVGPLRPRCLLPPCGLAVVLHPQGEHLAGLGTGREMTLPAPLGLSPGLRRRISMERDRAQGMAPPGVWQCSGHWLPYATWSFLWGRGDVV